MAPTTRAGSKRTGGKATASTKPTPRRKAQVKKTSQPADKQAPAQEVQECFRFLDLSPELRNRIYDFAVEDKPGLFGQRVLRETANYPHKPRTEKRPWKFFALTQACKQIRAEFRPLWIRDLSVRLLSTYSLGIFVDTFLHHTPESKHAPKLLQICWDHGETNIMSFDTTPLLRLVASCPSFRVDFVQYKIACCENKNYDTCHNCMERMYQEEHGDGYDSDLDECECPDYEVDHEEWVEFKYSQIYYTDSIRDIVHNKNETWLDAVREGKVVTVTCSFKKPYNYTTYKILYNEPVCETTTDSQPAMDLLKHSGIFALPWQWATDYIVAYEDKQITEKDGFKMTNSVVREVRISKVA